MDDLGNSVICLEGPHLAQAAFNQTPCTLVEYFEGLNEHIESDIPVKCYKEGCALFFVCEPPGKIWTTKYLTHSVMCKSMACRIQQIRALLLDA